MICLNCDCRIFSIENIKLDVDNIKFQSFAYVCSHCGVPLMDSEQMNEVLKKFKQLKKEVNNGKEV